MNKFLIAFLVFCLGTNVIFSEETKGFPLVEYQIGNGNSDNSGYVIREPKEVKRYIFASGLMFFVPGVGLSVRKGIMAYDFTFHTGFGMANAVSCTVSPTLYFSSSEYRPYASVGVGPWVAHCAFFPHKSLLWGVDIPARVGIESDMFTADIGIAGVWVVNERDFAPLPIVRVGFSF